ncbi:MAG: ABC transporter permease [Dehalococcoidia bacterium]
MAGYVIKRLLFSVLVMWAVSIIVFGAVRIIPGDICRIVVGQPDVSPAQCNAIRTELGLNKPVITQYFSYMGGVLHGEFGASLITKRKVWGEMKYRVPLTVELALLATVFSLIVAIPIGVISAVKRDKPADYGLRLLTIGWLSIPGFWVGTMLIILPAKWWGYSPPVGYIDIWKDPARNLQQLYLPAIALGLALSASLARITRSSMLEVFRQDYIRTARAKGLVERAIVTRHALRNAMIPVVTLFAIQFGTLLGGTVVLESIFSLPGLGQLALRSVQLKDYPQVQGLVLFFAVILILINLLVDISYGWFDPRIRYS